MKILDSSEVTGTGSEYLRPVETQVPDVYLTFQQRETPAESEGQVVQAVAAASGGLQTKGREEMRGWQSRLAHVGKVVVAFFVAVAMVSAAAGLGWYFGLNHSGAKMTSSENTQSTYNFSTDGWIVWLRRVDDDVRFNRTWDDYQLGFGDDTGNYWIGLEKLHNLTSEPVIMRVHLETWKGEMKWVEYADFSVGDEVHNYTLTVGGYNQNSMAIDAMTYNSGEQFTTMDRDNDMWVCGNCARADGGGGWWYNECSAIYPTALIGGDGSRGSLYMYWYGAFEGGNHQALKSLTMMIKLETSSNLVI